MWLLQPTTRIGRVIELKDKAICPLHGARVRELNPWCPWRIDPINKPYQIQCMLGGEWYPSNDYAAGDLSSGPFPDDGDGCHYQGRTYYFLREYAHMVYGSAVIPALRSLSRAYVLSGERHYGRKGTILLARLASEYPNHDERSDRLYFANFGGRSPDYAWKTGGMITDLIWETFSLEEAAYAYDGLWSYMDQDEGMLAFLRGQGLPVKTGDDLRRYIEHYLLRSGMEGILNGAIKGNEGHHQAAAMACALVLDDYTDRHPNSIDMVDYTFHGPGHAAHVLINGLTRDGGGHESPGYNQIKLDFIRVNRAMEQIRQRRPDIFPLTHYPDLFAGDKARRLFDFFLDLTVLDCFMPSIGDSGELGPAHRCPPQQYSCLNWKNLYAFHRYGDERLARAATRPDNSPSAGELFEVYPEAELATALASPQSRIDRGPRLLDGYGVGILASGNGSHRRALTLNYTSLVGHRQCDPLTLELFARGVALLPDLGYPQTWQYRWQWDANSLAHNTVTVDETQPHRGFGGIGRLFAGTAGVHVVSVAHQPYPPARQQLGRIDSPPNRIYERTVIMLDIDHERFYAVDIFSVDGGEQHDQSWHGLLEGVRHPELDWTIQESGTLAGPEVKPFAQWTDRWGRERDDFPAYLKAIQRAMLIEPAAWTWETGLPEGDALRLHLVPVGGPLEIIGGTGRSPAWPTDKTLDYVIARRQVTAGATSTFVTVLDPYQKIPVVKQVQLVSESPLVLEIEHAGGRDTIYLQLPAATTVATAHRPLGVRVKSCRGSTVVRDVKIGYRSLDGEAAYLQHPIQTVDYTSWRLSLEWSKSLEVELTPGRTLRIHNEERSALYKVVSSTRDGENLWVELDATALVARGQVEKVTATQVRLHAFLVFALRRPQENGELVPGPDYYAGSWLGEGDTAQKIRGAVQVGEYADLFLNRTLDCATWEQQLGGKTLSVWQYGVGDYVEIARMEHN